MKLHCANIACEYSCSQLELVYTQRHEFLIKKLNLLSNLAVMSSITHCFVYESSIVGS